MCEPVEIFCLLKMTSIKLFLLMLFVYSVACSEQQEDNDLEGKAQQWSEKDQIRLKKGFERIRWTFNEFIRRLGDNNRRTGGLLSRLLEQTSDPVTTTTTETPVTTTTTEKPRGLGIPVHISFASDDKSEENEITKLFQEMGILTSVLKLMQRTAGNIGGTSLNDVINQMHNLVLTASRLLGPGIQMDDSLDDEPYTIQELLDRIRQRINERNNRRCNKTSSSTAPTTTTVAPEVVSPETPPGTSGEQLFYQSPVDFVEYGNSMLKIFSDYTQQMKNFNEGMKGVSDTLSQMFHTGARIFTGQLRENQSSWSYGEPVFKGVSSYIEMMQNLQAQLTQLNNQWRELTVKVLPLVGAGGHQ